MLLDWGRGNRAALDQLTPQVYRELHAIARAYLGGAGAVTLDETRLFAPARAPDVIEIHEALNKLAEVDERKAKVVELRYFGGLSREEVAAALGLTVPSVKRDLRVAEAWLRRYLAGEDTGEDVT